MAHNPNNFNAISYRAKTLMALNNYEDALRYIKQALSIKYNKTLFKYLNEIESKQRKLSEEILYSKLQEHQLIEFDSKINNKSDISKFDLSESVIQFKYEDFNKIKFDDELKENDQSKEKEYHNIINKILEKKDIEKNNLKNTNEKSHLIKIMKEISLQKNINSNNNLVSNDRKNNLYKKDIERRNNNGSDFCFMRILKIIKIIFTYFVNYLKNHKSSIFVFCLFFLIYKKKSFSNIFKKIIGS